MVDDFLRPALDFRVAALYRVKVQFGRVGACGHGAGGTATHANAHAGATQLNQQAAGRKFDFFRLAGVDLPQTARDHDGLVVTALHTVHGLLVFTEIAQQIGPAKLVVEGRAAQWALGHDLQRAGNVARLAARLITQAAPEFGHSKARQTRLGFGATACGAFVANFTACAC